MKRAPRDKWVCRTFPDRLAQDLKEELRDQIRCKGQLRQATGKSNNTRITP